MKRWLLALSVSFLPILPVSAQGFGNVQGGATMPSFVQPFERIWDPGGYTKVWDIEVLSDGSIGVTGQQGFLSNGVRNFIGGADQSGAFYGRYDANGLPLKFTYFTSSKGVLEKLNGVALAEASNGDVFVAGYEITGEIYQPVLIRVTRDAQEVWRKPLSGPPSQRPYDLYPTEDGGVILFSYTSYVRTGRTENPQTWVAKISPDGEIEGQSIFAGSSSDMAPTSDGGFLLTSGTELLKLNSSGIEVSRADLSDGGRRKSIFKLASIGDGGATLAIHFKKRGFYGELIRFAPDGSEMWSTNIDLGHATTVSRVVASSDGTLYVGGSYRKKDGAANQPYIVRVSADGSTQTLRTFPGRNETFISAMEMVDPGIILVGGHTDEGVHIPSGGKTYFTSKGWLTAISTDSF